MDVRTLKTAMKIAPAMVKVKMVSSRRPVCRKVLRIESKIGREIKENPVGNLVEPTEPGGLCPDLIITDGASHIGTSAFVDREKTSPQGNQEGNQHLDDDGQRNDAKILQSGIHRIGDITGQGISGGRPRGYGDQQGDQAVQKNQGHIHRQDLEAAPADQLHHPNLAHMLVQQGIEGVDDQRAAQKSDQSPQGTQNPQNRQNEGCPRMLIGDFDFGAVNVPIGGVRFFLRRLQPGLRSRLHRCHHRRSGHKDG